MPRQPELVLFYDDKHLPVAAICLACGAQLDTPYPERVNRPSTHQWFNAIFDIHVAVVHACEANMRPNDWRLNGQRLKDRGLNDPKPNRLERNEPVPKKLGLVRRLEPISIRQRDTGRF